MNFIGDEASQNSDQTIDAAAYFRHWVAERTDAIHDPHWILVERDVDAGELHLVVGPYRGASAAHEAMVDSLLSDSIAEGEFSRSSQQVDLTVRTVVLRVLPRECATSVSCGGVR